MIDLSLAEIAAAVGGRLRGGADPDALVTDVVVDSREVTPGALFVALPGSRTDGHAYVNDAIAAGAVAVVTAADVDAPAVTADDTLVALGRLAAAAIRAVPDLRVVGITGSNGKTTTKDLVSTVLSDLGPTVAAPASYNGEVGLPLSALRTNAETKYLVLEYGARGVGHIRRLAGIARPDVGVVLGVGVAHVGVFGSVEAIATAKGELVESLPAQGLAVLNADDAVVMAMRQRTSARVRTFGRHGDADVRADDVALDGKGRAAFMLNADGENARVQLQLYGEHQVGNALAAAAVALEHGMSVEATAAALSVAAPASRWRMEVVETPDGVTLINDAYNANPGSVAAALRALAEMGGDPPWRARHGDRRRTWAVLGPMAELGDWTDQAHEEAGALAVECRIERIVAVGVDASRIVDGAIAAGAAPGRADRVPDVAAAVDLLRSQLTTGDVVLIKASRSAGLERIAAALTAGSVPA